MANLTTHWNGCSLFQQRVYICTTVSQSSFSQQLSNHLFSLCFWLALGGSYVVIAQRCHCEVFCFEIMLFMSSYCAFLPHPSLRLKILILNLSHSSILYWAIFPLYFSSSIAHFSGKALASRDTSRAKWPLKLSPSPEKISQNLLTEV